jgi:hypothetical protein
MKIDEDRRQRQCSILFLSVPSLVKRKILTQHFPNPSSSPLFPSPLFPWSGRRLTPETVFHLVPLCPFSCQTKDFNRTFSQPELVSSVPFPPVPLIWTKIDTRDSVRHCSLLSLLLWSEDQITFTEIICAKQSPLFRFARSFGLQEAQQCWELVYEILIF